MPGSYEDKFQQLKLLMTYLYTIPGKKLLFMGSEFAQFGEWNYSRALDWSCLEYESHQKFAHFFKCLTYLYLNTPQLYKLDHNENGFKWVEADNAKNSVYAYLRYDSGNSPVLVILNMTNQSHNNYRLGVPKPGYFKMLLDATQKEFFGYEWEKQELFKTNKGCYDNHYHYIEINIKSWGCYILKYSYRK
jgi:1,4-alpha-glucan branching enzyme